MDWLVLVFGLGFVLGWFFGKKEAKDELAATPAAAAVKTEKTLQESATSLEELLGEPSKGTVDRQLDNASTLLYFGAFLMITGVGLFVGLSDFSGGVKAMAVLALAIIFYGAGVLLYKHMSKLKPVGVTLTAIGLVCFPLAGAALYFYANESVSGPVIWFFTSVVSLLLYLVALWIIRQSLMGYMAVWLGVSVWLSGVAIIEAPVYFFGWAGIILAIAYLALSRRFSGSDELQQPLTVSASILVPVSLGSMIVFGWGSTVGALEAGISMLLASLFYYVAAWIEGNKEQAETFIVLSFSALPIGLGLVAAATYHHSLITGWVVAVCAVGQVVFARWLQKSRPEWREPIVAVAALSLVGAVLYSLPLFGTTWGEYSALLGFALAIFAGVAIMHKNRLHALFAVCLTITLPIILAYFVVVPRVSASVMGIVLVLLAVQFAFLARRSQLFKDILLGGSLGALSVAWLLGLSGEGFEPAAISLLVAATAVYLAYAMRLPRLVLAGLVLGYVGVVQYTVQYFGVIEWYYVAIVGALYYATAKRFPMRYQSAWLLLGVFGLYAAAFLHFATHLWEGSFFVWAPLVLGVAGALTAYEAYIRKMRTCLYAGLAVIVASLQWALYMGGVREVQIYTHIWSAYFAALAFKAVRDNNTEERDASTIAALTILTIPLAFQTLAGDTGWGYLLLAESIGLLLAGLFIRYKLLMWWGLSVAVGSILYQLKDLQFVVLVLLGLGIIGLGVYLLLRQEGGTK